MAALLLFYLNALRNRMDGRTDGQCWIKTRGEEEEEAAAAQTDGRLLLCIICRASKILYCTAGTNSLKGAKIAGKSEHTHK
jgi:hypothetical protein